MRYKKAPLNHVMKDGESKTTTRSDQKTAGKKLIRDVTTIGWIHDHFTGEMRVLFCYSTYRTALISTEYVQ